MGQQHGFSQIGVTGVDLSHAEPGLLRWLELGFHGSMGYMQQHGLRRARPAELVPGTLSVVTARMNYLPQASPPDWASIHLNRLNRPEQAYLSLYAKGRDYHKVLRQRLKKMAEEMSQAWGPMGYRVFTDSAPVLEVALAENAGLGWRGKHTLLLDRQAGSMFFLGEIYIDQLLPSTEPVGEHCGSCQACIDICPTRAIVAPYQLDARRCISYLTIEHEGAIPVELRRPIGNRIYGCDDCQLICPWNKFAQKSSLPDFDERAGLATPQLIELWNWTEDEFLCRTEGSAIRRIGYLKWLRNISIALGNALASQLPLTEKQAMRQALAQKTSHPSEMLREHIQWALSQQPDQAG